MQTLVEVCIDNLDSALRAEASLKVHRLEVCADLVQEGLTPSYTLLDQITCQTQNISLHVMIRNKPGDFFYTNEQIQEMVTSIKTMQTKYGDKIAGFVFGCLKEGKNITIHEEHTQLLIDAAKPKSITFHKAFDLIQDPIPALQVLINMGVNRVLTSGCSGLGLSGKAINHLDTLRALVQYAKDDIIILAGGGVRSNNAHQILKTGVKEVHSSQIIEL